MSTGTKGKPGKDLFFGEVVERIFPDAISHLEDWTRKMVTVQFQMSGEHGRAKLTPMQFESIMQAFNPKEIEFLTTAKRQEGGNAIQVDTFLILTGVSTFSERPK